MESAKAFHMDNPNRRTRVGNEASGYFERQTAVAAEAAKRYGEGAGVTKSMIQQEPPPV